MQLNFGYDKDFKAVSGHAEYIGIKWQITQAKDPFNIRGNDIVSCTGAGMDRQRSAWNRTSSLVPNPSLKAADVGGRPLRDAAIGLILGVGEDRLLRKKWNAP
ncbi:MAG: hypothetical protein WA628_02960 [Terriglobales bacterium]